MGNKGILEGQRREKGLISFCLLPVSMLSTAALHPGSNSWLHLTICFCTARINFIMTLQRYQKQVSGTLFSEEWVHLDGVNHLSFQVLIIPVLFFVFSALEVMAASCTYYFPKFLKILSVKITNVVSVFLTGYRRIFTICEYTRTEEEQYSSQAGGNRKLVKMNNNQQRLSWTQRTNQLLAYSVYLLACEVTMSKNIHIK